MPHDSDVAAAGDKLHDILHRAMLALLNEDTSQLRQILDREGEPALRAWAVARGRDVPSQYDFSPSAAGATNR